MKLAALVFILSLWPTPTEEPISIFVAEGKSLTITVPNIDKSSLSGILSVFFSRGNERAKKDFDRLFPEASSITLILSTEHGMRIPCKVK